MSQEAKSFDAPDEIRKFADHGQVKLATGPVGLGTFEPGWRWSNDVKPLQGTESCQVHHIGYVVSGRVKVVGDDGSEVEVVPGDVFDMQPGHDAWTVGDEACVLVDFGGLQGYAAH